MLTITVTDGPRKGDALEAVAGELLVIGRRGSWLKLPDPRSSRQHAELRRGEDGWEVADLGSTNGTFVNGQRIDAPTPIGEGDVIRIGRTHLAVSTMLAAESPPAADDPAPLAASPPPADPEPIAPVAQPPAAPPVDAAADDAVPSPDALEAPTPTAPSPADSVSAWDELELSPWEDGEDLASLLNDDDEDTPPPSAPPATPPPTSTAENAPASPEQASSETPQDDESKRGGMSLIWAALLALLIPAGVWAGAELGVIDVGRFIAYSSESSEAEPDTASATDDSEPAEEDASAASESAAADDQGVEEIAAESTDAPAMQADPASAQAATEPIDVAPPASPAQPQGESAEADWLSVVAPASEPAQPSPNATTDDAPRIQSLMGGPNASPTPAATPARGEASLDDVLVDLANRPPPAVAAEEPEIARPVEVRTMDLALIAEQAAESREPEELAANPAAADLANALTELDPALAVVATADGRAEPARFVEVQVASEPSAVPEIAVASEPAAQPESAESASPTAGDCVVYLVDVSGSMIDSFGAVAGWVVSDLERLAIQDRFAVITFRNGEADEIQPPGLRMPSVRRRTEVDTYLRPGTGQIIPGGRSDVLPAIRAAAALEPDRLVIVSDNSLNRRTPDALQAIAAELGELVAVNPDLRVDGVQLFYDDPRGLLADIADRFGGNFVMVTPESDAGAGNPIERLLR
ncbi:MAG: FHA domain-containing protein [Planctomycetota bacterium]